MRVVAGNSKGRSLVAPPTKTTRPTTDKVKEAIFNTIGPMFNGGRVLDLFAGSGGLGIEALSRGMDGAIFVDKDMRALQAIKENLRSCGYEAKAEVYKAHYKVALSALKKRELAFDLVMLDPPYAKGLLPNILDTLVKNELLHEGAQVVCEHDAKTELTSPKTELIVAKREVYGMIGVTVFRFQ
ncbi:16S rRNA (guanine(966)-N(2))-methyltransferase RsmD [Bacillus fonticola]|uniref:16S rRNA (guanine(966)-N(2))-methyltransferase RsmD n=1 Tax=Bacillus fonticola TaxID=2728853 RepID=UPI001474BB14|nr:16S rRNA (guanine(966)-N(2))-methyltransferase RsmD [Bacillus fonticola]